MRNPQSEIAGDAAIRRLRELNVRTVRGMGSASARRAAGELRALARYAGRHVPMRRHGQRVLSVRPFERPAMYALPGSLTTRPHARLLLAIYLRMSDTPA